MRTLLLSLTLAIPALLGGVEDPAHPRVTDVQISLFCDATGEWVSGTPGMEETHSWNLATGEGGAPCISNATMLVYTVEGAPNTSLHEYELGVVVTEQVEKGSVWRNEIASHSLPLGMTNSEGEVFVPVLLNRGACQGIRVGAGVAPPALVILLPFSCSS